jgi:2,3-dihydroxybiphenyl 1,2-dioxygenase
MHIAEMSPQRRWKRRCLRVNFCRNLSRSEEMNMTDIANLGYVVLGVSDFNRWKEFAINLGFQISEESDLSIALRMDQYEKRVILEPDSADDLQVAGWELGSQSELDQYVEELRLKNVVVKLESTQRAQNRSVQRLYSLEDPNGFKHEFYCGPSVLGSVGEFRSPTLKGSFVTGHLGLGHILVKSLDVDQSVSFYRDVLGLRISDYIREQIAPGRLVDVTFMHAAGGRHHSLATGKMPGNKILNHFMIEVDSMNDVGLAYDRCLKAGYPIQAELGRHPNDQVFSFYVVTPSGFAIELGWGGIVIDDKAWTPMTYDKLSDWGHKRKPMAPVQS